MYNRTFVISGTFSIHSDGAGNAYIGDANETFVINGIYSIRSDGKGNAYFDYIGQPIPTEAIAMTRSENFAATGEKRTPNPGEYYAIGSSPNCIYRAVQESPGGVPQTFPLPPTSYSILVPIRTGTITPAKPNGIAATIRRAIGL